MKSNGTSPEYPAWPVPAIALTIPFQSFFRILLPQYAMYICESSTQIVPGNLNKSFFVNDPSPLYPLFQEAHLQ